MAWNRLILTAVVILILLPCLGLAGNILYLDSRQDDAWARDTSFTDLLGPVIGAAVAVGVVAILWAGAVQVGGVAFEASDLTLVLLPV